MSTTTIERRNGTYTLIDNGVESTITAITKDGKSLILPENTSGRKFFALSKFEKSEKHDLCAINRDPDAEHTSRSLAPIKFPKSHYELHEQMTEDELDELKAFEDAMEIYMEMMERVWDRLHPKKEAMTEEQKLRNKLAKLQAQLEAMMNEEAQA